MELFAICRILIEGSFDIVMAYNINWVCDQEIRAEIATTLAANEFCPTWHHHTTGDTTLPSHTHMAHTHFATLVPETL